METDRIERHALVQAGKSRGAANTGGMMAPRQIIGKPEETNNGWRHENLCRNFSISSNSLPGRQITSMKSTQDSGSKQEMAILLGSSKVMGQKRKLIFSV
jgi:hypothetical protein